MKTKTARVHADRALLAATKHKFGVAKLNFDSTIQEIGPANGKPGAGGEIEEEKAPELPEDCTDIFFGDPGKTDGFYDIFPACSPGPIRVYCDFKSHMGLHIYHGIPPMEPGTILTRDLWRPEEVKKRCQAVRNTSGFTERKIRFTPSWI